MGNSVTGVLVWDNLLASRDKGRMRRRKRGNSGDCGNKEREERRCSPDMAIVYLCDSHVLLLCVGLNLFEVHLVIVEPIVGKKSIGSSQ
jgi:hypothetical protein